MCGLLKVISAADFDRNRARRARVEFRAEVPGLVVAGRHDDVRRELELGVEALEFIGDLEARFVSGIEFRRDV
jgi:hypothetical protein